MSDHDEGFSLVEAVVAVFVLAVVAVSTATLLVNVLGVTKGNQQRVEAANLANKLIEDVRGMRALDIPDGADSAVPPTVTVGSTTYTVLRTANYVSSDAPTSLCAGSGGNIVYKLITASVSWQAGSRTKTVRTDTLKALGLGSNGLSTTKGVATVGLLDSTGQPLAGAGVALCRTGRRARPAATAARSSRSSPPAATPRPSTRPATPACAATRASRCRPWRSPAGQVTRAPTVSYDRAGSARITWDVPVGFAPAATMGATLRFTGWSEGFLPFPDCSAVGTAPKGCLSGSPRTAGPLSPGNYAVWGGRCATAPATQTTATVTGGQPVDLTVKLAPVTATLKSNTGVVLPNRALYLIAVTGTACSRSPTASPPTRPASSGRRCPPGPGACR